MRYLDARQNVGLQLAAASRELSGCNAPELRPPVAGADALGRGDRRDDPGARLRGNRGRDPSDRDPARTAFASATGRSRTTTTSSPRRRARRPVDQPSAGQFRSTTSTRYGSRSPIRAARSAPNSAERRDHDRPGLDYATLFEDHRLPDVGAADRIMAQDYAAVRGQGVIHDRTQGAARASDAGIALLRRIIFRELDAIRAGTPPKRWTKIRSAGGHAATGVW